MPRALAAASDLRRLPGKRPVTGHPLSRRLLAEFLGAGLLVTVVVGSGIAAQQLSPGQPGLQLLQNSTATVLGLAVLILLFAPVSGAHLNPAVSTADWALGRRTGTGLSGRDAAAYGAAQTAGAVCGCVLANVMLARTGRAAYAPAAVGAYIGSAYWFTSSTSFANPAVTIGRVFTDTFAGIAPSSAGPFIAAQVVGAALGCGLVLVLHPDAGNAADDVVIPHHETEPRHP